MPTITCEPLERRVGYNGAATRWLRGASLNLSVLKKSERQSLRSQYTGDRGPRRLLRLDRNTLLQQRSFLKLEDLRFPFPRQYGRAGAAAATETALDAGRRAPRAPTPAARLPFWRQALFRQTQSS